MSETRIATPVVFYVTRMDLYVYLTDTPFMEDGYRYAEGNPRFELYVGNGTMRQVPIVYVETYETPTGPFDIDTDEGSAVIYPDSTPERHPGLHGRWKGARMTRLSSEEYNFAETPEGVTITRR